MSRSSTRSSSTSRGLGQAVSERSQPRAGQRFDREAQAYQAIDTSGGGSSGGGVDAPPSGGGGVGGSASLTGQLHEFAATDAAVFGIQSGHLVDGARLAFDLEDGSGDVEPLDGIVQLFENGVHLSALLSDYSVNGNTVTLATAPQGRISGWCFKAPAATHP